MFLCEFHESRQKTFSSSLRFPQRQSFWSLLDHLGICPISMAKYVMSLFFISRQHLKGREMDCWRAGLCGSHRLCITCMWNGSVVLRDEQQSTEQVQCNAVLHSAWQHYMCVVCISIVCACLHMYSIMNSNTIRLFFRNLIVRER